MNSLAAEALPRAGFWRRWLSSIIDIVIVGAPFQIIVAILFAATAGHVQMTSNGFVVQSCQPRASLPTNLSPAPPQNSNFARECSYSFFGATTGRILFVGRAERQGTTMKTVFRSYMIDAAGNPINGLSIDGYVFLVLIAYLVALTSRSGQTIGARVARFRIIDTGNLSATGVPLRKSVIRYAAMAIGFIPMLAVVFIGLGSNDAAEAFMTGTTSEWLIAAGLIAFAWSAVLVIQMAAKHDPIYDRIAGTAAVRISAQTPVMSAAEQPVPS